MTDPPPRESNKKFSILNEQENSPQSTKKVDEDQEIQMNTNVCWCVLSVGNFLLE